VSFPWPSEWWNGLGKFSLIPQAVDIWTCISDFNTTCRVLYIAWNSCKINGWHLESTHNFSSFKSSNLFREHAWPVCILVYSLLFCVKRLLGTFSSDFLFLMNVDMSIPSSFHQMLLTFNIPILVSLYWSYLQFKPLFFGSGELHIVSRVVQKKSEKQCRCTAFLPCVLQFKRNNNYICDTRITLKVYLGISVLGEKGVWVWPEDIHWFLQGIIYLCEQLALN